MEEAREGQLETAASIVKNLVSGFASHSDFIW